MRRREGNATDESSAKTTNSSSQKVNGSLASTSNNKDNNHQNNNGIHDHHHDNSEDNKVLGVQSSWESITNTSATTTKNGTAAVASTSTNGGGGGHSSSSQQIKKRKSGFLTFFARKNDSRQIKRIVYPHDNTHNNNHRKSYRYFTDLICIVGFLIIMGCIYFGGSGENYYLSFLPFGQQQPKFLHPRPITNIPIEVWSSIKGRRRLPLPLLLYGVLTTTSTSSDGAGIFYYPKKITHTKLYQEETFYKDYGDLDIRFLDETPPNQQQQHDNAGSNWRRTIYREPWEKQGRARDLYQLRDDDTENYWAFDWLRNPLVSFDDPNLKEIHQCRRNNWTRLSFPTGNLLHELDLLTDTPTLVGEGAYREVFIIERPVLGEVERFVLKEIRFDSDMEYDSHYYVRVDSLVTERMTSNQQIVNLYGYSGYSMLAECFIHGDVEEDIVGFDDRIRSFNPLGDPELRTWNNFTGSEKLRLALSMVQPVAALHNFKDGVIIHDDIQLSQFLWTDETKTSVKLNDFNRAEIMFWDEEYEEYCQFRNGRGGGDWRAPEEYRDKPLDDKIDVWSLGNNFYSLLGGYYPFFNVEEGEEIRHRIAKGATAKIDPRFYNRSFAERKLMQIIKRCHVYNPDDRADINEILQMLEDAIAEEEWLKSEGLTGLEEDEHDDQYGYDDGYYEEEDSESHSDYEEESYSDYGEDSHSEYEEEEESGNEEHAEGSHGDYDEEDPSDYEEEKLGGDGHQDEVVEESRAGLEKEAQAGSEEGARKGRDEVYQNDNKQAANHDSYEYNGQIHDYENPYLARKRHSSSSSSSSDSKRDDRHGRYIKASNDHEGPLQQNEPSDDRHDKDIKANNDHHGDSSL